MALIAWGTDPCPKCGAPVASDCGATLCAACAQLQATAESGYGEPAPIVEVALTELPWEVPATAERAEKGTRFGGVGYRVWFANGYGASVIRHLYSYGGPAGLWEIAVLDSDGELTYETPVTDYVVGRLSDSDVACVLREIAALR